MAYLIQITENVNGARKRYFMKEMLDCRRVAVFHSSAAVEHVISTLPAWQRGERIDHDYTEGDIYVLPRVAINDQLPF